MRKLFCLVPWMAMTVAWSQPTTLVRVEYGCSGPTGTVATRSGDTCWIPSSVTSQWGWRVKATNGEAEIHAEGRTLRAPVRTIDGTVCLNLNEAARQLGAQTWWGEGGAFQVAGMIRSIECVGSSLRVNSTLEFKVRSFIVDNPRRLVVDMHGLAISEGQEFYLPDRVRVAQNAQRITRLVIEDPRVQELKTTRPNSSRFLDLSIAPYRFDLDEVIEPPFNTNSSVPPSNPGNTVTTPIVSPRKLTSVKISPVSNTVEKLGLIFDLDAFGGPVVRHDDSTTIVIDMATTEVPEIERKDFKSNLIKSSRWEFLTNGTARLVLSTTQPVVYNVVGFGQNATITLTKPRNANGKLSGKRIVVDAGHGGKDSGATQGGVYEKTLTLAVSKFIAQELIEEGVNVIMTRDTDVFIPLKDRARIANEARADIFVSVHINSNSNKTSTSGLITFHHMQADESKLLARCIYEEIAKVNNMPDIGIWSDGKIYTNGFAVLRLTEMPATLLELGFITNPSDRAIMKDPAWQKRVAEATMAGIKKYVGEPRQNVSP